MVLALLILLYLLLLMINFFPTYFLALLKKMITFGEWAWPFLIVNGSILFIPGVYICSVTPWISMDARAMVLNGPHQNLKV